MTGMADEQTGICSTWTSRPDSTQLLMDYPVAHIVVLFRQAAEVMDGSQYFVLLILTDGVISDMETTKEAIVAVGWWEWLAGLERSGQ